MAEGQKPGEGAIVRADFGGGIDQGLDAWRVPPSQLADLVNGRLDKPGSVRKRYGYQTTTPPLNDAGAPIAALALRDQTVIIDAARDNAVWLELHVDEKRDRSHECLLAMYRKMGFMVLPRPQKAEYLLLCMDY